MKSEPASKLVEKQMRNWELAHAQHYAAGEEARPEVGDFLSLSRWVGIDSRPLADGLGERLGWPVFDQEILDVMAGDDFYRRQIYAGMDERDLSWSEEMLRSFFESKFVKNDYFHRLCETFLLLARKGSAIFVGRGVDLILPRDHGFRVGLIASREARQSWFAAAEKLEPEAAREAFEQIERERAQFFEHHFGLATNEPSRHDVLVNVERFTVAQAIETILAARRFFLEGAPRPASK